MHISELVQKKYLTLAELLSDGSMDPPPTNRVLVIDCVTRIVDIPQSPVMERTFSPATSPSAGRKNSFSALTMLHFESRERKIGSDMEILVRSLCSQQGWSAIISRRRTGCLACAIREAGALGYKIIVRVD